MEAGLPVQLLGERNLLVFHEECYPQDRFWWELPRIVETLRKAEGVEQWKDILQQQFSRDAWKRIEAWHSYSLICFSHLSTSDVHAKEPFCHSLVKWTFFCVSLFIYLFIYSWTWLWGIYVLSYVTLSSPFALILAQMQMTLCDMRPDFKLWWMRQMYSSLGVIIRGTVLKSKFPVQWNHSCLNKGLRRCYSAAPLYKARVVSS